MKYPTLAILATVIAAAAPAFAGAVAGDGKKNVVPETREDIVVHPATAPYWHEDSFVTNDLRPVFAYHHFPREILAWGARDRRSGATPRRAHEEPATRRLQGRMDGH